MWVVLVEVVLGERPLLVGWGGHGVLEGWGGEISLWWILRNAAQP